MTSMTNEHQKIYEMNPCKAFKPSKDLDKFNFLSLHCLIPLKLSFQLHHHKMFTRNSLRSSSRCSFHAFIDIKYMLKANWNYSYEYCELTTNRGANFDRKGILEEFPDAVTTWVKTRDKKFGAFFCWLGEHFHLGETRYLPVAGQAA